MASRTCVSYWPGIGLVILSRFWKYGISLCRLVQTAVRSAAVSACVSRVIVEPQAVVVGSEAAVSWATRSQVP